MGGRSSFKTDLITIFFDYVELSESIPVGLIFLMVSKL